MKLRQLVDVINISLVSSLVFLGVYIVSPILHQYATVFNVSVALTGWAISAYAVARVIADLPAGMLIDKYGVKKVMIFGLLSLTISSLVAALAPDYFIFIFARALGGFGSSLYIAGAISCLAHISQGGGRGKIMSMYSSMVFLGMAAGPLVTGFVATNYGIHAPFYIYTLLAGTGLLLTVSLEGGFQAVTQNSAMPWSGIKEVFSNWSFVLVGFSVLALFFLRSSVRSTLLPLYASINLNLGADQIGLLISISMITTGIFTFPVGWLSDRLGRRIPIMTSSFSCAFLSLLIPFQATMENLIALSIAYGIATGLQGAISAWPADIAPLHRIGTAMGAYRFLGDLGFFLGPITVTYLSDYFGPTAITLESFIVPVLIVSIAGMLLVKAEDPAGKLRFRK